MHWKWNTSEKGRRNKFMMDCAESEGASSVYSSPLHTDHIEQSRESGWTCKEEAVAGPSQAPLPYSPASNADSLHCMALDSDFSDVEEDFHADVKSDHHVDKAESGPLLRANKVSTQSFLV